MLRRSSPSSTSRPPSAAETDPLARFVPHCPRRAGGSRPGPRAIASPMARGLVRFHSLCDRDANSHFGAGRSRERPGGRSIRKTSCAWGHQQSLRRSCCCRSRSRPARAATTAGASPLPTIAASPTSRFRTITAPKSWRSCRPISTIPSACATPRWPSRCSAPSAAGCAMSAACASPRANPTAPIASRASGRPVCRRPARPHGRERQRGLRRRGLCAVSGTGKDAAVAASRPGIDTVAARPNVRKARMNETRSLFGEALNLAFVMSDINKARIPVDLTRQKTLYAMELKRLCGRAVTVAHHRRSGIAAKQPN